ncbi:MAG: phosphoglycerate kinase [Candidatus Curtissbacteria bacterium]|nr:phosphoglycerate kinase [Candidatus Curtissbacteria bacterium]
MKLLSDLDVSGKRVFLRADLDVPLDSDLKDEVRLRNIKPTFDYLLEHGASQIMIAGHIGRPEERDPALSTDKLLAPLAEILGRKITFKDDLERKTEGEVVLLDNLRFWPGEEANDPDFAKKLAFMADFYINDAFGDSHRAHASIIGVPAFLTHAAGIHLQKEVEELSRLLEGPERPFVAVVGGAKMETKIPIVNNLAQIADKVLVGGLIAKQLITNEVSVNRHSGVATTTIGSRDSISSSRETSSLIASLQNDNKKSNVIVASLTPNGKDIDDVSVNRFVETIKGAKTVVWNGPVGFFEEGHESGTMAIAKAIIDSGAYSVVGGGETTEFLASKGLLDKFSFVSSGGGAMLEFLAGRELPGIRALE